MRWSIRLKERPIIFCASYRNIRHARMVASLKETDKVWWENLQSVCLKKVQGMYKIDKERLS